MQVILQEKIKRLGNIGDLVTVKPGYARNYLLAQGKALRATAENVARVEERRKDLEKKDAERKQKARKEADALEKMGGLEVAVMANSEGRLFGALNLVDVLKMFKSRDIVVDKSKISVVGAPVRQTGTYDVLVECHAEITAVIPLRVISLEPQEDQDEEARGAGVEKTPASEEDNGNQDA